VSSKVQVCTIVLSYNRPRMLREALRSINGADHVILLDDASDFDVWTLAKEELGRFPWHELRVAPRMTVQERMRTPRLGKAINMAIRSTFAGVITYLCDDDLFHKDWLHAVRQFFSACPAEHAVRADWGTFDDGQAPGNALCPRIPPSVALTTGNFAHTRECSISHDLWWHEGTVGSHDGVFVPKLLRAHPLASMYKLKMMAGWRREHPYNMLKFVQGTDFAPSAKDVLERKELE
jgi:glycosyltransferase involved in cell wall biosynthesis